VLDEFQRDPEPHPIMPNPKDISNDPGLHGRTHFTLAPTIRKRLEKKRNQAIAIRQTDTRTTLVYRRLEICNELRLGGPSY
jgi:hypothetical protein